MARPLRVDIPDGIYHVTLAADWSDGVSFATIATVSDGWIYLTEWRLVGAGSCTPGLSSTTTFTYLCDVPMAIYPPACTISTVDTPSGSIPT